MTDIDKHTGVPWKRSGTRVLTIDGLFIAECGPEKMNNAEGDAAFICLAVNSHEDMLHALREAYALLARLYPPDSTVGEVRAAIALATRQEVEA